jgi:hypothetical protein
MYGTTQHCTMSFPTTHAYDQASMMRMCQGNEYVQENFIFPNVTQNVSTRSDPVREMTFTLLLPRYARKKLDFRDSVIGVGAGRLQVRILVGVRFSVPLQTEPEATPTSW